jgi:tRNA (Thr-GGU) A37 N-methylase
MSTTSIELEPIPRLAPAAQDLRPGVRVVVEHLEARDQTPVLDIKPVLEPLGRR